MSTASLSTLPSGASYQCASLEPANQAPHPNVKQSRILIVDDESVNIDVVQAYLELDGYHQIQSTEFAVKALPLVDQFRPDLILLDIHMPEINGLEILRKIRADAKFSTIPVVILTATATNETKIEALQAGATDLLSKPVNYAEMLARISNVLSVKAYQDQLRCYSEELEHAVRKRTAELEASRLEVIHCLARAAEFRDDDTGKHIIRVGRYARLIGEELGLSEELLRVLEPAAQLHDVGKIGIPDAILLKPGKLTPEQFAVMQKHCGFGNDIVGCLPEDDATIVRGHADLGAKIMDNARSPILNMAKRIALSHHERWDGTGYPAGLSGEDIPFEGRITAVADVFDALSSSRAYKSAFPLAKCFEILKEGRGTHFDPHVLDAFFARRADVVQIQIEFADSQQ